MSPVKGRPRAPRETLNIRIQAGERKLIDRADKSRGKARTDFILEAARCSGRGAARQALIVASPKAYAAFLARLEIPPQPNERLRKTMRTPAPWDQG